jgi:hypothetical protein
MTGDVGVEGNARMTGVLGAVLLAALAVEGVTIPNVRQMFTLHVFLGLFVIPVVCLKLATTGYRFFHYYRGTAAYRHRGPPHPVLRISVLGSGVVTLAVGPQHSDTWLTIHQASFIVWVAVTSVHVIGHIRETWTLTAAEMRGTPHVPRRGVRTTLVACSLAVGLLLGAASLGWTSAWRNRPRNGDGPASAALRQH